MDHTASHHLPPDVGSFSYSWPTSKPNPQLEERTNHGDIAAFIEMDPSSSTQCSFDFRLPSSEQTAGMVDADQMFLNGLLLPLQLVGYGGEEDGDGSRKRPVHLRSLSLDSSQRMIVSASKRHRATRAASLNSSPSAVRGDTVTPARSSAVSRGAVFRACKLRLPSFGRSRRKQHKWISSKYLKFLVPLYERIVGCVWRRKAKEKAKDAPHRAEFCNGKVRDLGKENAIRDAILHCKRSL
ncbi:uncharacterized protein LOC133910076 [Phragmites australis]|uniref:uncharacterized protein LOC133910076 n=1 Tax=Phragmites australis TaxID=29695 RepID=UPI002D764E99|nr:uncharacterized protein LOC133910076 [Phragmites australis]